MGLKCEKNVSSGARVIRFIF